MEHLPEIIKVTSTGISIIRSSLWLVDYFARHETIHVKEHLGRTFQQMSKYIQEKNQSEDQGDTWRNDWFSENQVSGNRIPRRLLEKTVKEIINDSQESKSEHIAKFWVNVCLTSNAGIDEATAFAYFETIESLSWRQLCIIRLVILCDDKKVDMISIKNEKEAEKWIEQMPQDDQTSFYSISREYEKLANDKCFEVYNPVRHAGIQPPLLMLCPEIAHATPYTRQLHSLMNLYEIPMNEIIETFSIWNVRLKKSEELGKRLTRMSTENLSNNPPVFCPPTTPAVRFLSVRWRFLVSRLSELSPLQAGLLPSANYVRSLTHHTAFRYVSPRENRP